MNDVHIITPTHMLNDWVVVVGFRELVAFIWYCEVPRLLIGILNGAIYMILITLTLFGVVLEYSLIQFSPG
jgi:hypothetical protein